MSLSESNASLEYYRSQEVNLQISAGEELQDVVSGNIQPQNSPRKHTLSKRIPFWLWYIIAKCLGIKLHENDKPILSTVLYTFTFSSAIGYILSNVWFTSYDIVSEYSKTTVIDGSVSVLFSILWGALGLYANNLAYRLYSHRKFLDMLRLHSKSILKMNASILLFLLMAMFCIVDDVNAMSNFMDSTCEKVSVSILVCKARYISRVVFSIFTLLWNYLVAFVVISVCRTHTIGIRRFMQSLEQDGQVYESRYLGIKNTNRTILEEYTWVDEDYLDDLREPGEPDTEYLSSVLTHQDQGVSIRGGAAVGSTPGLPPFTSAVTQVSASTRTSSTTSLHSQSQPSVSPSQQRPLHTSGATGVSARKVSLPHSPEISGGRRYSLGGRRLSSLGYDEIDVPGVAGDRRSSISAEVRPLMTNSEILYRYWKIQSRLRLSSVALQRWMMSIISLVSIWLAVNLVYWLTYDPTIVDLADFFLPMLFLPLLSTSYAEVNQEGHRLLKFICLTEERLPMIHVLNFSPLEMNLYGFTLSYSTISTAMFGIILAFASKVLIQEVSPVIPNTTPSTSSPELSTSPLIFHD